MSNKGNVNFYDNLENLNFVYGHYESPFYVAINSNHSLWMERYCSEWIIHNVRSLVKDSNSIRNSDLGLYSACTFPTANWHRLEKLMKWCTMFFIIDDYQDQNKNECNEMWLQFTEMLKQVSDHQQSNSQTKWPDFIKATETLLKEIYFDFTEEQINRSANMIMDYIHGNMLEKEWLLSDVNNNHRIASLDKTGVIPDWNTYMNARLGSVGGQMTLQLIEYAKGIVLSDEQWNHPLMKTLIQLVSEEMTLVNDFLTFRKEVAENDYKFSKMCHAFTVLVNQGMNLQEAVDEVHRLIKEKDKQIISLIHQITMDSSLNKTKQTSQILATYLDGVQEAIGGYWRYCIQARRYHGFHLDSKTQAIPPSGRFVYDEKRTIIINHKHNGQYPYDWLKPIPDNVQPN